MIALARCGGVERLQQRAGGVLLRAEDPQALARPFAHLRRIAAEERRRRGDQRAVDDGEVQRHVVALDAPAPRHLLRRRRRAEDREEVLLRIAFERRAARRLRAGRPLRGLQRFQHGLEIHDRRRGQVAALAQPGLEQVAHQLMLRRAHVADQESLARKHLGRDEMPVRPLVRLERKRRLLKLRRLEALQQRHRRSRHRGGGSLGGNGRADGERGDQRRDEAEPCGKGAGHAAGF